MDAKLSARILDVLKRHHFLTLATIRPDGYPQATIVNYVHDDLTIYFATDATSQKAGNIQLNDKVSVAIASETQDAYKLRSLSLSGTAKRVIDAERLQNLRIRLFQELPEAKRLAPEDAKQLAVFAITPVAVCLVEYASGYGKTYLVEL